MKFIIEMNVHELVRSIEAGTLEALVRDVQAHEDQVRKITKPIITKSLSNVAETEEKVTESKPKVAETEKEESPVVEDPPQITIEQVRAAFIAKNSKDNTPKLKDILNQFGVKKVTDLQEKDFPAILKALEEI